MVADPVGHGLNQHGLVFGGGDLPGLLGGVVHGQHVIAVHPDGGHPVGGAPHCDAVPPVLLTNWCRDGVPIVATKSCYFKG